MRVEDVAELLGNGNHLEVIYAMLNDPKYAGKHVILSSDDLTGRETDEELENTVSLRELVYG